MGIRGLTTFIENRSHLYMEKYELHDTNIVIDGNAIACQLYKWHCKSNDCFGGDYDKYASVIHQFFQILKECEISPYVVLDGGYENRKVATVISRMKNKISAAERLNSATEGSISVFPLFLKETFQDVALKLNVKCVRCDYECDSEVASIARTLSCPVLSYDSDFFIFDVSYIPFSTFDFCVRKKKLQCSTSSYKYISCELYKVEKFLNSYGELDKSNLPILAVLLGNDYIKRSVFSKFFEHLKTQKCNGSQNEQQKRIKSLMVWLQNETVDSAINKILSRYNYKTRKLIAKKLENAMKSYNCINSIYLKYLLITPTELIENNINQIKFTVTDDNTEDSIEDENFDDADNTRPEEDVSSDGANLNFSETENCDLLPVFEENFRKCVYPPSFMDILKQNKYYCIPQVENSTLEFSHAISSEILSAIHKILTNSNESLTCIARNEGGQIRRIKISVNTTNVPSLSDIQSMDLELRKETLLKILKIDTNFIADCLLSFPESWHLFIITIKYLIDKYIITLPFIYALLISKIFLSYIDKHLGICRSTKVFEKKFEKKVSNILNNNREEQNFKQTIMETLNNISYDDSLWCLKNLISYFKIQQKMRTNNKLFDRNLIHTMAQFQSCFLHVKYLNCLLNFPFQNFVISEFYNGTFVYNLTSNFTKRINLDDYITMLLQNSPSVYISLKLMTDQIKRYLSSSVVNNKNYRKTKKKKKQKEIHVVLQNEETSLEETSVYDPNNRFSLLSIV